MITEPEMADEFGEYRRGDEIAQSDGPARGGGPGRRRPWLWALGGILAASVIWTAVLRGTDYGQTAAPELHGYHLDDSPCTGFNLKPLADDLDAGTNTANTLAVRKGKSLDYISCELYTDKATGDRWMTSYTVAVTVALHKKSDPRTEFEDDTQVLFTAPDTVLSGGSVYPPRATQRIESLPGLGDRAYLTTGVNRQCISVLHGGGVFTLTVEGRNNWTGDGEPPMDATGALERPLTIDTRRLRSSLPATMRHLMKALSAPSS